MASSGEPFLNAVLKFEATLTSKQLQDFKQNCTLHHVEQIIRDLQTSKSAERRQRNMHRISKFIEGMNQLGQVVEVFLNVDRTVALIWGPIKFLLVTANTFVNTLDCLLDTYSEIGDILPSLTQYHKLLDKHPNIRVHLENYYCDILEFHRKALDVFARPSWKVAFHSAWKTFRSQFNETLTKLKRHRDLLCDEQITAAIFEVRDVAQSVQSVEDKLGEVSRQLEQLHLSVDDKATMQHKQHLEEKRRFVFSKLDAPEYSVDLEMAVKERKGGSSGDWILAHHSYREWVELTGTDEKRWLYLNGIPGTGKTIIASRIVEHLQSIRSAENRVKVVFFFFKHAYIAKRTPSALLLSILSQLASQDEVTLDLLYQQLVTIDHQKLKSVSALQELASMALASQPSCYIVVDGLDECVAEQSSGPEDSQNEVIQWMETACSTTYNQRLRILISGQRNGFLDQRLRHHPSIQLEGVDGHTADIKTYAHVRTRDIQQKFKIQEAQRLDIVDRVSAGAKGMFLYAKIVLSNLLSQTSRGLFKRELNEENFPKGLEQAYERVVVRILENPNQGEREAARRILGHVICSPRPLLWKEIQAFFCIDVDAEVADPEFQLLETAKYYCGSLIETTQAQGSLLSSENIVDIVHETARGYLLHTSRFSLATLHTHMTLFCARYLTSTPFTLDKDEARVAEHCKTGFYAIIDYTAASWWKHWSHLRKMEIRDKDLNQALQAVNHLSRALRNTTTRATQSPEIHLDDLVSEDARDWEERFPVEHLISPFRKCVEEMAHTGGFGSHDADDPSDPSLLYGKTSFKCSKPWCGYFLEGFGTADKRDEHIDQHNRPYRCTFDGCHGQQIGFANAAELAAHNDRLHQSNDDKDFFPSLSDENLDIFHAIRKGDLRMVEEITSLGTTDINETNIKGERPLLLAARAGHYNICQHLLQNGARVDAPSRFSGNTALYAAVAKRDLDIVHLLITSGANVFARSPKGGNLAAKVLAAGGAIRSAFPQELLLHQHCKRDRCLLSYPVDDEALNMMISNDDLEGFKSAMQRSCLGKSEEWNGNYITRNHGDHPLNIAISKKANNIAEYSLRCDRFDISNLWPTGQNDHYPSPLEYACDSLNKQMFDQLLPLATSLPNSTCRSRSRIIYKAFKILVASKYPEGQDNQMKLAMMGRLVETGMVPFNNPDPTDGRIPLHHACEMTQDSAVLAKVLTKTANANLKDKQSDTPFGVAIREGNFVACRFLLDHGAIDLGQISAEEAIVACTMPSRATLEFTDWLVSRIKDQNSESNGLLYALHTAAFFLNLEAIKLLLTLSHERANFPMHEIPRYWLVFLEWRDLVYAEPDLGILATPLFIAMNRICGKQKALQLIGEFWPQEEKILACRAEFKPIFDAFCQSSSLDLSERSKNITNAAKMWRLCLILCCCDDEVVARMANAGLDLPWDLMMSPSGGQRQRGSTEIFFDAFFSTPFRVNISDMVRAFINSGNCKLADIITENFDLAMTLIDGAVIRPYQVGMTQGKSMWCEIENSKDVAALKRLITLGMDKGTMLLGAARNGMLGLVEMLSQTGLFDEREITIAHEHAQFVQQDRAREFEKASGSSASNSHGG